MDLTHLSLLESAKSSLSYTQVNKLISLDDLSSSTKSSSTSTSSRLTLTTEGNKVNDELLDFSYLILSLMKKKRIPGEGTKLHGPSMALLNLSVS